MRNHTPLYQDRSTWPQLKMSFAITTRNTTVAILAFATYEEESEMSKSSDIDLHLFRKCRYSLHKYSRPHRSCGMLTCCGVAESNEGEDIVLSNCEVEITHDSEHVFVYETGQSCTDKQQEFKEVDFMYFLHGARAEEPRKEKQMQKKKVMDRKYRNRRHMKGNSWFLHHKTRYHSVIREMTLQPYRRRHRKNCTLKRYRMFKFRMFLVLNNLRIVKRSDASAQVEASENMLEKVLHNDWSGNDSVEIDENVLHSDVSVNSSVEIDENVLHSDVSANSSVEIDENVLHNDVSANSSVEIDENLLHSDVSVNSSVEIDDTILHDVWRNSPVKTGENFLHNDVSEESSVKIDENVVDDDVFADSSVKIDENVVDDDVFADSSVEFYENVLNGDVSRNSSVEINKDVLHGDVPADSSLYTDNNVLHGNVCVNSSLHHDNVLHGNVCVDCSIHYDNNLLHSDLSTDSSLHKDNNVISDTLCRTSSVHIKHVPQNMSEDIFTNVCADYVYKDLPEASGAETCENYECNDLSVSSSHDTICESSSMDNFIEFKGNLYDDLFENHWESVENSKKVFDEVKSEDSCFKVSKALHNSHLNLNNAWSNKAVDSTDWMLKSSGIDSIRSYMDITRLLGIYPRYSHNLPMFWQEITLYPFTHSNNPPGDLLQLMRYEVFRLCSFSYARFPADFDVWVTRLAQAGFYCENEHGRIICFNCGCEFRGPVGSSIDDVHHPDCQRSEHSRPLHVWTQGLNQEILAVYYSRYGSLRPYNFEVSGQQNLSDDAYSGLETTQASAVTEPQAPGYSEPASGDTSGDADPGIPVWAEVTTGDAVIEEATQPEYHSQTLPADLTDANRDPGFGDQLHSLPGNLNEVSGAIVSEESQDTPRSYQVLTSAASNPMPFYNPASRGGQSQAADRNENGAVGGAGVALDLSKASYPLFSSAEARRQSFTSWSHTHSHRPEDLVAAGFFYAGYADCVRCFYCGLGLKYWRPTDIPAYQHARYRPQCVYNRLYKGQDYIDRVQQDLQGTPEQLVEAAAPAQGEAMTAVVQRPNRVLGEVASVTATPSVTAPSVPDLMNSEVAQEAMRNGWDRNQVQQAIDHIVREFGVHGFEISLLLDVLTNLNMDNPERNLPSGGSASSADSGVADPAVLPGSAAVLPGTATADSEVIARGGTDVADATHEEADATPQPRAVPIQQPAVPPIEFNELFMSVEREHTLLAERTTCRLCRRRPVSCIYLPCGHVIACQECADNATHCILCSKQIIGTANIYLA